MDQCLLIPRICLKANGPESMRNLFSARLGLSWTRLELVLVSASENLWIENIVIIIIFIIFPAKRSLLDIGLLTSNVGLLTSSIY